MRALVLGSLAMLACSGGGGSNPTSGPVLSNRGSEGLDDELDAEIIVGRTGIPENLLARQMAIEQARAAGILGTVSGTPRPKPKPPAGPLDKVSIRREIHTRLAMITLCYEQRLAEDAQLQGTTKVTFVIGAEGRVMSAAGSGFDPEVDDCVASAVEGIRFPAPDGGGTERVTCPFTFRPSPRTAR
jgi:hypothetical protein